MGDEADVREVLDGLHFEECIEERWAVRYRAMIGHEDRRVMWDKGS